MQILQLLQKSFAGSKPFLVVTKTTEQKELIYSELASATLNFAKDTPEIGSAELKTWQKAIALNQRLCIIVADAMEWLDRKDNDELLLVSFGFSGAGLGKAFVAELELPNAQASANVEFEDDTFAVIAFPSYPEALRLSYTMLTELMGQNELETLVKLVPVLFQLAK